MRFFSRRVRALALIGAAVLSMLLAFALPDLVSAHAAYDSSVPAANSVVKTAPTTVTITFKEDLDPKTLNITVYDNKAKVVSTGTAQISNSNPKVASVSMIGDGSDIYRVDWNNVSADDGDPTLGAFVFAVDPSGKSDKVSTDASTSSSPSSGVAPFWAVIIGLAGLVVGAGGAYLVIRPRPTENEAR
jgi:methionine-rich copper-binding protein CopC